MKTYRYLRVGSLIHKELGKILLKELDLASGTLATISAVEVSSDLAWAKVFISIIPAESGEEVMRTLNRSRGRFQRFLNRKMNIKPMPQIRFERDFGLARAAEVEKLLERK
jgi:ribosome-binding factor A